MHIDKKLVQQVIDAIAHMDAISTPIDLFSFGYAKGLLQIAQMDLQRAIKNDATRAAERQQAEEAHAADFISTIA